MGYDLHITRAADWSDNEGAEITAEEWLAFVAADPELTLAESNGPCFVHWSGPSIHSDPWLDWAEGNIYTKNPDQALMDKMVEIACRLNARVQGDDGEVYDDGSTIPDPDEPVGWLLASPPARPWWKRLIGR
jgi:hypothetical protein